MTSLLRSSVLFPVFSLILIVLWSGWSRFFLWSPVSPVSFSCLLDPFQCLQQIHRHFYVPKLFCSLARTKHSSIFSLSLNFTLWFARIAKPFLFFFFFFFFLLLNTRTGLLSEIRWFVCVLKSEKILCISFSRTYSCIYIYHLVVRSNFDILHNFL